MHFYNYSLDGTKALEKSISNLIYSWYKAKLTFFLFILSKSSTVFKTSDPDPHFIKYGSATPVWWGLVQFDLNEVGGLIAEILQILHLVYLLKVLDK